MEIPLDGFNFGTYVQFEYISTFILKRLEKKNPKTLALTLNEYH